MLCRVNTSQLRQLRILYEWGTPIPIYEDDGFPS